MVGTLNTSSLGSPVTVAAVIFVELLRYSILGRDLHTAIDGCSNDVALSIGIATELL